MTSRPAFLEAFKKDFQQRIKRGETTSLRSSRVMSDFRIRKNPFLHLPISLSRIFTAPETAVPVSITISSPFS